MSQDKNPALVVLAAGMGSRYGGFKQLDSISMENESIMDLSIQDAIKAGFKKIVLVINRQISEQVHKGIILKYQPVIDIQTVFQDLDRLPDGFILPEERQKPWGTAHAILSARERITTPFAVINADDFYGSSAYLQMQKALSTLTQTDTEFCMIGYRLENTLSNHGGVSRGLCSISGEYLSGIKEIKNIRKLDETISGEYNGAQIGLPPDAIISMNFWGFTPQVFVQLEEQFGKFLQKHLHDTAAEFFITDALDYAIGSGLSKVKVLTTTERWYGVTFREDRDEVKKGIRDYYR